MPKPRDTYDAVIIGAGIGGLVCGCYLAKAGMRVLIAEQHYKPGGYCTSFKRKGFTFDAAAHCLGGYKKDGYTRTVFDELGINKKVRITRSNPSTTVMTSDYKVSFQNDLEETIRDYQRAFPSENASIKDFFYCLISPNPMSFARMRNWTFKDLLDHYFKEEKLKAILAAPLLGTGGLPPSLMSAFIGAKIYSEFLIDGGYYLDGGIQALPDALAERFIELGGDLRLSRLVKKIRVKDSIVEGIVLEKDGYIPSRYVVSNCDARQTFFKLLSKRKLKEEFCHEIKDMMPSMSYFIVYLGTDGHYRSPLNPGTNLCFFQHYDPEKAYRAAQKCDIDGFGGYFLYISHDKSTISAFIPTSYKNKRHWVKNKHKLLESVIDRVEKSLIPDLSKHIIYKDAATPYTLYRYTLNYAGASFGWAVTPSQLAVSNLRKPFFIHGLYLTGHWTTFGIGIPGVVYVGQDTAKLILRKEKKEL